MRWPCYESHNVNLIRYLSVSFHRLKNLESNWFVHFLTYLLPYENDSSGTQSLLKWGGKEGEERGENTGLHSLSWIIWPRKMLSPQPEPTGWPPFPLYGRRQTTHVWFLLSKMFSNLNYFHFLHCRISLHFKQIKSNFKIKKNYENMLAFLLPSCLYGDKSKNYCFVTTL